jgi:hypothetical protein
MTRRAALLMSVSLLSIPGRAWAQGNPLGPEFRVNTYTTGPQAAPSVAAAASGNFVVAWQSQDQDGASYGVFAQRFAAAGAPLGLEFRVNTYTPVSQGSPSVAANSLGDFVVAWESQPHQDGSYAGIFAQRYASSGAPLGTEFRVNTYTTGFQTQPAVASAPSGAFIVVWRSGDGSSYGVFGQRYAATGIPAGPEFRVNTATTQNQQLPQIAADGLGGFVVVWQSYLQDGAGLGVFGQRLAANGAPLGPEFRVNTYTTDNQFGPAVAADTLGDFVVVWESFGQDGSTFGVFGQRYLASGAPAGPEFRVNTYTTGAQGAPVVAADPSGNFVVSWSSYDGSSYGLFGQRFAASGAPLGPEFRVNTFTLANQLVSAVAADPSGRFVIVWRTDIEDGSGYGVFGQRYGPILPVELMRFGVE